MNKEESEPESTQEKKSIIKKFFETLRFYHGPDTKEELESEIQELLEEGEEQGLITSLEEQMISSIFDFRETLAAEIMTPAIEIHSVEVSTPVRELVEYVVDSGYTRTPIYKGNNDRIVGIVHVKDLLKACTAQDGDYPNVEDLANPAYFVSEQKPILDLLREFQKRKVHMAVVTDEFGTTRGLITLEDILEEIVGEIDDEFDVNEVQIETVDEKSILVQGRADIEDVEEKLSIVFPDGPYESIGGLLIHHFGRIPKQGAKVDIGQLRFEVKDATSRYIKTILISVLDKDEE